LERLLNKPILFGFKKEQGIIGKFIKGFMLMMALLGYALGRVGALGVIGNYYVYKVFLAHQKKICGERIVEVSKKS